MRTTEFFVSVLSLLAATAIAAPADIVTDTSDVELEARGGDNFKIHVWNNCAWTKQFALYQITGNYQMVQKSPAHNIAPHRSHTFHANFYDSGMRLSGHAERGVGWQWNAQALFEFGHSAYGGTQGTAYDLSVMRGSDNNIGIGVWPKANGRGSGQCPNKVCFPWNCPAGQGWTDPSQSNQGSPADTVCYKGKTDFKVVYCP